MAQFHAVLQALNQGRSVRRDEWEPVIRMFVLRDLLMCQCGTSKPWNHSLGWEEITANDWQLAESTTDSSNIESSFFDDSMTLQAEIHGSPVTTTWTIERNNGSRATLASMKQKKEIKRPKRMTRRGFFCLLTPGAEIDAEALGTLFRLWL
jgi:hypothetical protein